MEIMSFRWLITSALLLLLAVCPLGMHALAPTVPRTEKSYSIHVQPLTESLDDAGEEPTLVSVTKTTTLWLPRGSLRDGDEHLSFNDDLDPFWVHVLRRRRFDGLEWSGCGGAWRSDWGIASDGNSSIDAGTRELVYGLSHHAVCFFSGLSACGWAREEGGRGEEGKKEWEKVTNAGAANSSIGRDVGARRHHQWLAQFVSSLLSSPLSWSKETPRHIRPVGLLRPVSVRHTATTTTDDDDDLVRKHHWCSYHLAQHDTVCTQHVSPLLNGGRRGSRVEEHIPDGVFRAGVVTMQQFFSSKFHHFHFRVSQSKVPSKKEGEETKILLLIRMAFVALKKDFYSLAAHWEKSLPAFADRLTFFVGPHVDAKLASAIQSISTSTRGGGAPKDNKDLTNEESQSMPEIQAPTAHYYVSTVGHDRGTYTLMIHPPKRTRTVQSTDGHEGNNTEWLYGLNAGDTLESLLIFPLHVLRPSLHEMRSDPEGSSVLQNAFVDDDANVLVVLVKTVITESLLRYSHRDESNTETQGFIVSEFPFKFGWAALKDMPMDANSYRILPQPVIRVGRHVKKGEEMKKEADASTSSSTSAQCASIALMRIDHQISLERLMNSLGRSESQNSTDLSSVCYYWIRCTNVAGTTIPVPDPAMVFNVISLGVMYSGVMAGGVARTTRYFIEVLKGNRDI